MPTFRIREDVMTAERRAKKNSSAGLADDRSIVVERTRSAAGIQHGCSAVSKRTVKGILPPHSHRLRRWSFDFLFKRCAENKPVRSEIIFFGHIGEQIIAHIQLRMHVQVDKSRADEFSRCV